MMSDRDETDYDLPPDRTGQVYISGHGWAPEIPCKGSENGCTAGVDSHGDYCGKCAAAREEID